MTKTNFILSKSKQSSYKTAAPEMKHKHQKENNPFRYHVKVTIYTSDECAFCQPAIDTVRKAIDEVSSFGYKPQVIISRIETKTHSINNENIFALPTISIGRFQLTGLPEVEEVEHLLQCAIMETSF